MQKQPQVHLIPSEAEHVQARRLPGASQAALLVAALAAVMGHTSSPRTPRKERRPVPRMVCSPAREIAAWNDAIDARKPSVPSKLHRKTRGDTGQHPKLVKDRVHKQHEHPLRDEHGAYTQTGGTYEYVGVKPTSRDHVIGGVFAGCDSGEESSFMGRRKWLAGISAQRGY